MVVATLTRQPTKALAEVPTGTVGIQLSAHMGWEVAAPLLQLLEERTQMPFEHPMQNVPGTATPFDCRRHPAS